MPVSRILHCMCETQLSKWQTAGYKEKWGIVSQRARIDLFCYQGFYLFSKPDILTKSDIWRVASKLLSLCGWHCVWQVRMCLGGNRSIQTHITLGCLCSNSISETQKVPTHPKVSSSGLHVKHLLVRASIFGASCLPDKELGVGSWDCSFTEGQTPLLVFW